ncbi:hypothetical protein GCM10007304_34480 [Rhodococcoides trifolii]|uniref:Fe/B12 periplasmic-binding domain-containing protein n=1 Tax=Rhodococcoides trifolii TaxID=908250 RepID=A0A917LF88_9NOCA|nr:ABC transporter substrate-binding protein [Rhodococcus trifolii]GGG17485.1 hypothetical protein GCM10007304_34480 [Rhodococcus trifolii]
MTARKSVWLLVLAIVLTACGSGPSDDETASTTNDSAYPVTVETKFGGVTLDARPTRVVALGWGDAETALALGVQPVGASDWLAFGGDGVGPWAQGLYDEPPTIIGTLDPSYEQVAALAPDVILDTKSSGDRTRFDTLSAIAPTVALPPGADNYTTSYEDQVTLVSAALGVPDTGAELISGLNDKFAAAAAAIRSSAEKRSPSEHSAAPATARTSRRANACSS